MATHTLCKTLRLFNYKRGISYSFNLFYINNQQLLYPIIPQCVNFYNVKNFSDITGIEEPIVKKKKKVFVPQITLLNEKNDMSVLTLEEAQKIAKRRNLKLVKIVDVDVKSERPVYKLMMLHDIVESGTEMKLEETNNKKNLVKNDKTMTMSSRISEHDLDIKIKSIHKMLGKNHGVRAVILIEGNKEKSHEIAKYVVKKCNDIATTSTAASNHSVKVILRPILTQMEEKPVENQETFEDNTK